MGAPQERYPMRSPLPVSLFLVAVLATSVFSHAYAASDPSAEEPLVDDRIAAVDAALLESLDEATLEHLRAQARPMIRPWDLDVEKQMQQPIPEIESGIGPGSALRISRPDGTFTCTANFIWTDDFDQLYLGTAGHCLLPNDATATHGPGADYDRNKTRVDVRTGECPISGAGVTCGVGGSGSPWQSLGAVTYARYTQLGTDFGLVEIPSDLEDQVRYEMPMWGGPDREGAMATGDNVFHYGQGIAYGEAFASRGRTGLGASSGNSGNWDAAGFSNPGDSGSAVVTGGPGAIEGERAIGLLTHGIGFEDVPVPGLFFGTHTERAKTMVGDETGLRVWTLPGGEPLADMEKPEGRNNTTNLEPGTVVVRHENEESTTTRQNYRWSNGWDRVRIIVNAESEQGEVRLQVRDEDNNTVFSMDTQASYSNDRVVNEAPRNIWNITVDFEGHVGTVALRIEQADDDDDSSGSSGGSGGSGGPGSGQGKTSDADSPEESPRPLPAPAFALVLLVLAAVLKQVRRRRPHS